MGLDFIIIERGSGVGGTWYWNTYPGIGCDIPSHSYSYSFYRRPSWTLLFSGGSEIYDYCTEFWHFAKLEKYTIFDTEVMKALWSDEKANWTVTMKNIKTEKEETETFTFLVSGVGGLHRPSIPNFKDKSRFLGQSWHTTAWPKGLDDQIHVYNREQ